MASTQNSILSTEERTQLLKNLVIPPRPAVLDTLMAMRNDPSINLQKIGKVISTDIALSAAILKAANSPVLQRGRRIASVPQAISLLGIKNVVNLVSGLVLRTRLTGMAPPSIEHFWERAMQIAMISNALGQHLGLKSEDSSSYALFHSCGIALMLMRFSNFDRTLDLIEMASDDRVSKVEIELHGTSHDIVGYLVALAWNMPESFSKTILLQYDPGVFDIGEELPIDLDGRMMIATTRAATNVWRTLNPANRDPGWDTLCEPVLGLLGFGISEFEDWRDSMHHQLAV